MRKLLIALVILVTPQAALAAKRQKICADAAGSVYAAKKCKAGETELNLEALQGAPGINGTNGQDGASAFDIMPPGTTVTGRLTRLVSQLTNREEVESTFALIPGGAGNNLSQANIVLKVNAEVMDNCDPLESCITEDTLQFALDKSALCTGTAAQPTAPPGLVCVYPFDFDNIINFAMTSGGNEYFSAEWNFAGDVDSGLTYLDATWAYTEPATGAQLRSAGQYAPLNLKQAPRR